jgi:hypothetical protein
MLAPAFAGKVLFPWLLLPAFPAKPGLCLWLMVKGVNVARWERGQTRTGDERSRTRDILGP